MEEANSLIKLSNLSNTLLSKKDDSSQPSSTKVEKAGKFLLLPEISRLSGERTKATFLLSKGLTPEEVAEAFSYFHKYKNTQLNAPSIALHNVSQHDNTSQAVQIKYTRNPSNSFVSSFFFFCQKFVTLVGISSALYYFYQKWHSDEKKEFEVIKEQKRIEKELNFIKTELEKITVELRSQQLSLRTNANLSSEINSLKAILVSRQYFEEKQKTKLSLPSWQLTSSDETSTTKESVNTPTNEEVTEIPKNDELIENTKHLNGDCEVKKINTGIEPKVTGKNKKNSSKQNGQVKKDNN